MAVKSSILKVVKANDSAKNLEIVEGDLVPKTPTNRQNKAVDIAKVGSETTTNKKAPAPKKKSLQEVSIAETQPIQEIAEIQAIQANQLQAFAGATKQKKKSNKVIPPIPERTPEEQQAIRNSSQGEVEQQARISFIDKCLDLADANQTSAGQLVVKRIEPCVGIVADNIAKNSTKFIFQKVVNHNIKLLHDYLLSNPSIIDPTWNILVDHNLSVREKGRKLNEIGWEPEIISINGKGQDGVFQRIYLLARILERGIV